MDLARALKQRDPSQRGRAGSSEVSDAQSAELFEAMHFQFPLRKYQSEILDLVQTKLANGEKQLHIVAPPGAGKTIIGLQIISMFKQNSLILSPNTTIQSQWGQKVDLFLPPDLAPFGTTGLIGTHEDKPLKPVTMLTYQVLSTPGREQQYLEKLAHTSWVEELTTGRAISYGDAELRILELLQNNPKAHQREISRHVSRLRKKLTDILDLKDVLHSNALELLQALKRQHFGVVIFDECHHLTDYWAAIMTHLVRVLGDPIVIGLTGTPPEGKSSSQETRYLSLVGEIDYQVPTPALVKEGGLAPFQDLAYFTEPTPRELDFLREQHEEFHLLIEELTVPGILADGSKQDSPLTEWVKERMANAAKADLNHAPITTFAKASMKQVATQKKKGSSSKNAAALESARSRFASGGWTEMLREQPELAQAFCRYLWRCRAKVPPQVQLSETMMQAPGIEDWMRILDDFASRKLKIGKDPKDHELYERIRSAARKLGYGITEQGLRKQASPVDRVLAFSNSKPQAVAKILETEHRVLQDRLRCVVVTDFERTSATAVKTLKGVLDQESGGALAALKLLLEHEISAELNPCLVTGSLLLVDNRIRDQFVRAAQEYLDREEYKITLEVECDEKLLFSRVFAESGQWESKLYVGMATAIFERGITKCLIGTRGLFGEGWDSQALNTLIDLTTTTSPVSVKQLRGRSIRIQTNDPLGLHKVANNWDVVCIAPHLEKGLNDYDRFVRKHECFFGLCDDGRIECGVGHVHPEFSDLTPIEVFAEFSKFNDEMIQRAVQREQIFMLWGVGKPYLNRTLGCVELAGLRRLALTPPHIRKNLEYRKHARELQAELLGTWAEYGGIGLAAGGVVALAVASGTGVLGLALALAAVPLAIMIWFGYRKYQALSWKLRKEVCKPNTLESSLKDVATAVLTALQRQQFVPATISKADIQVSIRQDGTYRVSIQNTESRHTEVIMNAFKEAMAPITDQPYLIPKYEYFMGDTSQEAKEVADLLKTGEGAPLTRSSANEMLFLKDSETESKSQPAETETDSGEKNPSVDEQSETEELKEQRERQFFKNYVNGKAKPRVAAYHPVPSLLARSEKGREAFESAWNKYVSPGFIVSTEKEPILLERYFRLGPRLAQRTLWE